MDLPKLSEQARAYLQESSSANTRRTYATAMREFRRFAERHGARWSPASAELVAAFLTDAASRGCSSSTVCTYLAGVRRYHELLILQGNCDSNPADDSRVKELLRGIKRKLGTAPKKKRALTLAELRLMVAPLDAGLQQLRDKALLLLGWFSAMRRSELASLSFEDVEEVENGIEVTLRRSKTDQEGRGAVVAVPYASDPKLCPVRALRRWREALAQHGITTGPLFRRTTNLSEGIGAGFVWAILRARAADAKLDPSLYGGHSLRSGFATAAAKAGKRIEQIQRHLRHASPEMTLRYVQQRERWEDNAAVGLG